MKLNNFQIWTDDTGGLPPKLVMTLSPTCNETFQERVIPFLEVEIMQGTTTVLPDGYIEYELLLSEEKAQIMKQALFQAIIIDQGQQN